MPQGKTSKKASAKKRIKKTPQANKRTSHEKRNQKPMVIPVGDTEKYTQFNNALMTAIEANNYVLAYQIINQARNFVTGEFLSEGSFKRLEKQFEEKLQQRLLDLGFVDISNKIVKTAFWAMVSSGNLALKGPPGVGKSFFAKEILPNLWIEEGEKPQVIVIQPDRNMDIATLVAERGIKKGDTVVEEGQIADAFHLANNGKNVILILEEINQWPSKVLKDLNDFLEERKLERKIAGKCIKFSCQKERLFIIANYNPEGYTLGDDDTGSVSSRFTFCDLAFPSKEDLQQIIEVNVADRDFAPTIIGDEIKRHPTKPFLRAMSDICYSIRSSIEAGELGTLAMPLGTRHIINFSRALIHDNSISDAITKTLVDPILEKYVREGPLMNIEPEVYEDYVRTIFKAVKQVLGTIDPVNEKNFKSLQKGLDITISELFKFQGKKPYKIIIREGTKPFIIKPKVKSMEITSEKTTTLEEPSSLEELPPSKEKPALETAETITQKPKAVKGDTLERSIEKEEQSTESAQIKTHGKNELTKKPLTPTPKEEEGFTELLCLHCGSKMSLAKDSRGKRNLICNNLNCRNILPVPQYGKIEIYPNKCHLCSSIILTVIRRNRKIIHICPVCWRTPTVNGPCESCKEYSNCLK
ncbi:MAG: AAA family ATPase [Candidatus Helarchaeota archaeon]